MPPATPTPAAPATPAPQNNVQSIIDNYKAQNPSSVSSVGSGSNWYSQMKANITPTKPVAQPQETSPSLPSRIGTDLQNRGSDLNTTLQSKENPAVKGLDIVGQGAGFVGDVVGEGAKSILSSLPNSGTENKALSQDPIVQLGAHALKVGGDMWSSFQKAHPEEAQVLGNVGNIASLLPIEKGGEVATDLAEDSAKGISDTTKTVKTAVMGIPKTEAETEATKTASNANAIKSIANEWQKPTEGSTPAFNKARDVLAKDKSIPQFLAEQKANPGAHINEDDRFETSDTAQALRDSADKMSTETLRPSLVAADYSTQKTPVSEVRTNAIRNAMSDKSLTPGERITVIRNINKETSALTSEHPDGMGLADMHDSKITYAQKGGYSPIKSASDNAGATANRHIASALQKAVEEKAPEGVPVKAFNQYLSKYYKSADYLDALDGKKAPISWGKKLARAGGKFAGLAIGSHIGGGGILADVAGYRIGGVLEHAVEHMTAPTRSTFLKNLEVENPKAFTQVQSYLKAQNTGNNGLLRLPPATSETPIPLGSDSLSKTNVAPYAAKTKLPVANPKTGRMMRVYTSEKQ